MTIAIFSATICLIQIAMLIGFMVFDLVRRRRRIAAVWRFDGFASARFDAMARPHRFGSAAQAIVYLMPVRARPEAQRRAA